MLPWSEAFLRLAQQTFVPQNLANELLGAASIAHRLRHFRWQDVRIRHVKFSQPLLYVSIVPIFLELMPRLPSEQLVSEDGHSLLCFRRKCQIRLLVEDDSTLKLYPISVR